MLNSSGTRITRDTLFNGKLFCNQHVNGYRFSVDAVLVAHFCRAAALDSILDLGCGCGIISLILAFRLPRVCLTGLEVQPELVELARLNIADNNLVSRLSVVQGNLCAVSGLLGPESFDLVVCNPPYRDAASGRISPTEQRARARHEIDAGIHDIIHAAAFAVKNRGRVVLVYPAKRFMALVSALKKKNLEPKRVQPVYSYPESSEATLILVEAVKNGGEEVALLPSFYIYEHRDGPYSEAMQAMYRQ